jgi:hypothetical protein
MEEIELQDVSDLHGFIANGRILDILCFIEANPNEKVKIFDGESAIAFTLKFGDFEIYEILVAHGFKLAIGEDYGEILSDLDDNPKVNQENKFKLREIHRKYMKESTKKHLFRLNLMSKLAPTTLDSNREKFEAIIAEMFEELMKLTNIAKIMKYASSSKGESKLFEITSSSCNDEFCFARPANLF